MTFEGRLELRPFGAAGPALFLGTEIPVLAALQRLTPRAPGWTCSVEALIEGCTPKRVTGAYELDVQVVGGGGADGDTRLRWDQRFAVGGKDVLALLEAAEGRRMRLTVEFHPPPSQG